MCCPSCKDLAACCLVHEQLLSHFGATFFKIHQAAEEVCRTEAQCGFENHLSLP